jgi:hypothetical protein
VLGLGLVLARALLRIVCRRAAVIRRIAHQHIALVSQAL